MCQSQSRLNYNKRAHKRDTQGILLEDLAQVISEIEPLSYIGHLLHKATWSRLGDIADALKHKQADKMIKQKMSQMNKTG